MLSKDIDFSAVGVLSGEQTMDQLTEELWNEICRICSGELTSAARRKYVDR